MKKNNSFFNLIFLVPVFFVLFFAVNTPVSYADDFNSTSYKVMDPIMDPAGYGTSSNFQLWSTISQVAVGTSSSASYEAKGGFLEFPYVDRPTASSTPYDSHIVLNWTPVTGYGGWTISSYSVGTATNTNGPYTYNNVGNVYTYDKTGLTNGTQYYFVIVANDFFGNAIATSTEITNMPVSSGLTFSISSNVAYFGSLNPSVVLYASSTNVLGDTSEVEAHNLVVNTGAVNGYTLTVQGSTLTSQQNGTNIITPLSSNTVPSAGNKQFGLRAIAAGGLGTVAAPYTGSGFAYTGTATTTSQVASASSGDNATTTYSIRYTANINTTAEAGNYTTNLVYVATANF